MSHLSCLIKEMVSKDIGLRNDVTKKHLLFRVSCFNNYDMKIWGGLIRTLIFYCALFLSKLFNQNTFEGNIAIDIRIKNIPKHNRQNKFEQSYSNDDIFVPLP